MNTTPPTMPDAAEADAPADERLSPKSPWPQRLAYIDEMMRDLSRQTDAEELVATYGRRVRELMPSDGFISLSRRGLDAPWYRITRSSAWEARGIEINPWLEQKRLPLLNDGIFGKLIYADRAQIIDDLDGRVSPDDPGFELLDGMRSLMAIPLFDGGEAINMVVVAKHEPNAFHAEDLPERVWMSNLFGRATRTLALSEEVKRAYDLVDRELKAVADIQRSLLPTELPRIPGLDLAAYYQTSQRAGGDYYDFFPLPGGKWGILIADVSGHGTPAAVLMAVTHSIAHNFAEPKAPPSRLLKFVNDRLATAYTGQGGHFVTAFYGVYDPADGTLNYANAGHPPPRLRRAANGDADGLGGASGLPLGIEIGEVYPDNQIRLLPGDALLFYTDGITEARNAAEEEYGPERLDVIMDGCNGPSESSVRKILRDLRTFTADKPASDDRTLLVMRVGGAGGNAECRMQNEQ